MVPPVHADVPTENVIIVYKDNVDEQKVDSVNGDISEVLDNIPVAVAEIPAAAIPVLEKSEDILTVEVDQRVSIHSQVQDWGIQSVNAPISWESKYTGQGIKIAVLDTGISAHEDVDISGGVAITDYTKSYHDDNGHGTHVAGIIGAKNNDIGIVGIAPDAQLYAVKVLDKNGSGYLSDVIAGIDWSITNKMDIINLSLGAPNDSVALHQAVDRAYHSGLIVVAAAGNNGKHDGSGDTVEYPARYDSTIAVAATDSVANRGSFSATGNTVEISAPGVNILSTHIGNRYVHMSGTSMAAPYVTGVIALLKQVDPSLSNGQLREKLKGSAIDLGIPGKDSFFGYGLVQAPVPVQEVIKPVTENKEEKTDQVPSSVPAKETIKQVVPEKKATATKPAPKKKIKSTVSTYRTTYSTGNTIWVNLKAIDQATKKPVKSGTVKLTITPPKGKAKTVTLKTNKKGEASYKMVVNKRTTKGLYKFSTSTSVKNYQTAKASKTIRIK